MHHIDQINFTNYSISIAPLKIAFTSITAVKELNSCLTVNIHSLHLRASHLIIFTEISPVHMTILRNTCIYSVDKTQLLLTIM